MMHLKIEYDKKVVNRIKRAEGQMRGVQKMMDEESDCQSVVTQLKAIRSSLDRAIGLIVAENLVDCLEDETLNQEDRDQMVQQAVELIVKTR